MFPTRKNTQPKIVNMPRRSPSNRLHPPNIDIFDRLTELQQQQRSHRPAPKTKSGDQCQKRPSVAAQRLVTKPGTLKRPATESERGRRQTRPPPSPSPCPEIDLTESPPPSPCPRIDLTLPSSSAHKLPGRIDISTYVQDPVLILRQLLSKKTDEKEPEKHYTSQITVVPCPKIVHHPRSTTMFPGVKLHRLWKLKPGLYRLLQVDKPSREVLLRNRNNIFRTPLPSGVMVPPDGATDLEVKRNLDTGKRLRVSVNWVSV